MKSQEDQFKAWLAGARADLYSIGVPGEQAEQVLAEILGENNLDDVRADLPPLGGYDRATAALRHYIATHSSEKILEFDQVITSGGTQSRAELDEDTIKEYAAAIAAGDKFPPVVVFYDGEHYYLADGFHRLAAAKRAGRTFIAGVVRQGTRRDAVLHSVGANHAHGLRRTNADKRRAVETLLTDEEWMKWSDSEIARRCGVSHTFVQNVRKELSCNDCKMTERTASRNGTTYSMGIGNIGGNRVTPGKPTAVNAAGGTVSPTRPLSGAASAFFPAQLPPPSRSFVDEESGHNLSAEAYYPVNHSRHLIGRVAYSSRTEELRGTSFMGYPLIQGKLNNSAASYAPYQLVEQFPPPSTKYWHGRYGVCPTCSEREGHEIAHGDWEGTESANIWLCPRCERRVADAKMKIVDAPSTPVQEEELAGLTALQEYCPESAQSIRELEAAFGKEAAQIGMKACRALLSRSQEELGVIMGSSYGQ